MSSMTGEGENSEGKRKAYFTVPCFCYYSCKGSEVIAALFSFFFR